MKKIKFILSLLCGCVAVATYSQSDSSFQFIRSIKGNFSYFNVDNLDNVYLVTNTNQLKKIDEKGDSVGVFNDVKRYSNLSSIDGRAAGRFRTQTFEHEEPRRRRHCGSDTAQNPHRIVIVPVV